MSAQIICCYEGLHATERKKWANTVLDVFAGRLPDLRLIVYLDSIEWWVLKEQAGSEDNRGVFRPVNKHYYNSDVWPWDVQRQIVAVDECTLQTSFSFDGIVYPTGPQTGLWEIGTGKSACHRKSGRR